MGHSRSLSACAQPWNDETFVNEPALVFDPSLWALNLLSSKSLIDAQNIAISPCGRFVERKDRQCAEHAVAPLGQEAR
jgi:hypothetical protein